ncbi:MAG TPA: Grx4 family monothiol glutaredoxin [Thermoanaerobaculales bacterium]|nr:Grx4 family monothiol glutaredoxin [Thermoanaerobaculales bacterium]HQL30149.1 Grx4 family monothiol glutaredoxin [Thermoanaerobaculales bacterium]
MTDAARSPFAISAPRPHPAPAAGMPVAGSSGSPADRVRQMVGSADIFVFMKGTPVQPACGFSASTVAILDALGAQYATFDVLADEAIRAAAKEVGQWPTFPQVWVRGELIGGADIVAELHRSGELAQALGVAP